MTSRVLGIGFLTPAIFAVSIFFLLPVLLTVVFAFTNTVNFDWDHGGGLPDQYRAAAQCV